MENIVTKDDPRVPVTILTGFLGSGKTTLLNRILTEKHEKRIAVIENEFGAIGLDRKLVHCTEETVFEMNNGCICCAAQGDFIRILDNLMSRRDSFDHVLIETTGLADPGPVALAFYTGDEAQTLFRLDGIVTLIDARHVWQHIDKSDEVKEQIALANVILLNKIDLVSQDELSRLEICIQAMNTEAKIYRTESADVEIDAVLQLGGFNFHLALHPPISGSTCKPGHRHDNEVSSLGITVSGDLDKRKFYSWMSHYLQASGADMFRMKGVLSLQGEQNRFIFQGVHALFDGKTDRPWKHGERHNQLVFIGRNLNCDLLYEGFKACLTGR